MDNIRSLRRNGSLKKKCIMVILSEPWINQNKNNEFDNEDYN
jgi:hypothetical protein